MKTIKAILVSALLLFMLAACTSSAPEFEKSTLTDNMTAILKDVENLPANFNTEVTAEFFEYYLFIPHIEGAEALAADASIGTIPHSVVLLRLPEGSDVKKISDDIKNNADPRKWICVEADKVTVTARGNTILLVMSAEAVADSVTANFNALK